MGFQQHPTAVDIGGVQGRAHAQVGHALQGSRREAMYQHRKNPAGGGLPVRKAQIQGFETERAAQLASVHYMARDAIRPAQKPGCILHAAMPQSVADGRTGHAQSMHLVAVHAGHVKTVSHASRIQHAVVARALCAKPEVVTHQNVPCPQAFAQYTVNKFLRRKRGKLGIKGQHHRLVHAAIGQVAQFVAQSSHPCRGQVGLFVQGCKVVSRMRLKGEHATGHATLLGLAAQERQHGLVATVHAIKIADRHRAGGCHAGMLETAKDLHGVVIFLIAGCVHHQGAPSQVVT